MWEIYAYHNTESLVGIFNAIAAIMASGTYLSAVAAVAFCGFVAAMLAYMFAPEKLQGWKWIGTVVLVYGVLFVPRVTVGIVDKTGGTPVRTVDNVPFGMAALGGLTSSIGNTVTELFETAFQTIPGPGALAAELSYQQNGLMFGSRMIQETRRASLPDPALRSDLVNFVSNCTAFDLADGTISPTAFSTTSDLWSLMAFTNPARFSILTTAGGVTTTTCDQVYQSIDGRLPAEVTSLRDRIAQRLNPTLAPTAARAAAVSQIEQGYIRSQIAAGSATAADLVRQNALMNAINDAGLVDCQRTNDPSCMMLATGRATAVAQQNAAWINGAKIAEQALPVVRNVAEAMTYAVFPLIVLLLFLTSGRNTVLTLAGYATVLVSIQLWPPLFAILNYMATIYAQMDQSAAAEIGGGAKALALQTGSTIYSNAVSAQAVVSYLVIGIPPLAYSLANRLVSFGTTLVGGLSGLQSTVGNVSSAAAVGNANMGNVTMDQRVVSPSMSNPFVSRQQDGAGNWRTLDATGREAVSLLRNEGMAARVVSSRVSASAVTEASSAAEAARSDVVSANMERSASLTTALSTASSRSFMSRHTTGTTTSSFEEIGKAADKLSSISKQVAASTGLSSDQVQQIAFQLSANAHAGVGVEAPLGLVKAGASVGVGGSAGKTYSARLSAAEQQVLGAMSAEQLQEFKRFGDRVTRDAGFLRALSSENREGNELASRLAETTARSETAQAAFAQRRAVADRLSRAHESGETISVDLAQLPQNADFMFRYARMAADYGENSQALQMAIASELATRALPPTRHFSDGSAAPSSFDDVRTAHRSDANGTAFSRVATDDNRAANDGRVRRVIGGGRSGTVPDASPQESAAELGRVRGDVDSARTRVVNGAQSRVGSFDDRNEITRDADGTVGTRKSLVLKNARQVRDDVQNLGENVKEAVVGKKLDPKQ